MKKIRLCSVVYNDNGFVAIVLSNIFLINACYD